MKNTFLLLCGVLCMLTSCGISSRYSSTGDDQRFSDAIYSSSPSRKDKDAEQTSKEKLQKVKEEVEKEKVSFRMYAVNLDNTDYARRIFEECKDVKIGCLFICHGNNNAGRIIEMSEMEVFGQAHDPNLQFPET